MDKTQRLEQLNRHREGPALTEEEIVQEYDRLYRAPAKITPWTNPELFDPLNPPPGWEYDAWHAIWWQPTQGDYKLNLWTIRLAGVAVLVIMLWALAKPWL